MGQGLQIKFFDFLPGPRGFTQELQAGGQAGIAGKTIDIDVSRQIFPAVLRDQLSQQVFQGDTVQGRLLLGFSHLNGRLVWFLLF